MAYNMQVGIENLRSLAFGSITGSYTVLSTAFAFPIRTFCITNNTDADVLISTDGTNNKLFVATKSYKLYDLNSNKDGGPQDAYKFCKGTQLYIKYVTAPSLGSVYLETFYALGE